MTLKIKHVASISKGRTSAFSANDEQRGVPLINMRALRNKSSSIDWVENILPDCEAGDIVVCWDGANSGEFFISKYTGALASTIGLIKTISKVDRDFVYYFLSTKEDHLRANIVGMGIPHLNPTELRNIKFPLITLQTQKQIAAFLDCETARIDALIAKQERTVFTLKEYRAAAITHAVMGGLDKDAPTSPSGVEWIGDIPAHWDAPRIAALFREAFCPGEPTHPVLSVSIHNGVTDGELADEDRARKVALSEDRTKYQGVAPDDLVYNMMRAWQGAFGAVTVHGLVSPAYVVAKPIAEFRTKYIEHLLHTKSAAEEIRRFSRGIADFRMRLYWDHFRNLRVCLPPLAEQDAILAHIEVETAQIDGLVSKTNRSIELLKEKRVTLITAAVTGQIDVDTYGKAGATSTTLDRIEDGMQ